MTDAPATPGRRLAWAAALAAALLTLAGCSSSPTGEVSGTVAVDGRTPAEGSSITFVPAGGAASGGGGVITDGRYAVTLTAGDYKVEIRVPEPVAPVKGANTEGPGPGGVANIKESLPAKYNDRTELTFAVKQGKNEKNWELTK